MTAINTHYCFDGDEKTLTLASGHVAVKTFKELYRTGFAEATKRFCVPYDGGWSRAKLVRLPARNLFRVELSNGKSMIVTDNHINATADGDKYTFDLTTKDYVLFNTSPLPEAEEENSFHTYSVGYLAGLYLSDGVYDRDSVTNKNYMCVSLSKIKCSDQMRIIKTALDDLGVRSELLFDAPIDGAFRIKIISSRLLRSIRRFVTDGTSSGRRLNLDVIAMPPEFRRGVLDGCKTVDTQVGEGFYCFSQSLAQDIEAVVVSLGYDYHTSINTGTIARSYSGFGVNGVQYVTTWEYPGESAGGEGVLVRNDKTYFKVESIAPYNSPEKYVYSFRTIEREPYFFLANGIVTHH